MSNSNTSPYPPLAHADANQRLPEYCSGSLENEQRALVAEHIASCADCRSEIDELHLLFDAAMVSAGEFDGVAALDRMQQRIANDRPRWWSLSRWRIPEIPTFIPRLSGAAAALGLTLAIVTSLSGPQPTTGNYDVLSNPNRNDSALLVHLHTDPAISIKAVRHHFRRMPVTVVDTKTQGYRIQFNHEPTVAELDQLLTHAGTLPTYLHAEVSTNTNDSPGASNE